MQLYKIAIRDEMLWREHARHRQMRGVRVRPNVTA